LFDFFLKYLRTMGSNEAISRCEFNALELVDLRNFFDSVDTSSLDDVSFGALLTQLDKLKVRYDPSLLASAFAKIQEKNNSKVRGRSENRETFDKKKHRQSISPAFWICCFLRDSLQVQETWTRTLFRWDTRDQI
jgi:hypothetical protein